MRTLLSELSNMKDNHDYTIIVNGVCSYVSYNKENIKLNKVTKKYQALLDFRLSKEKTCDNSKILRFVGKTQLTDKEVLEFLLCLVDYNPDTDFKPKLVTIALLKESFSDPILFEIYIKWAPDGRILNQPSLWPFKENHISIIGDYYFADYFVYQSTLTKLSILWIDDYKQERKKYKRTSTN